jgi:hypothetical protein
MDIQLTETKTYSFKLGDKLLDGFVIASEWNGMTELRGMGGEKIIVYGMVRGAANGVGGAFGEIFGDIFAGARKPGEPSSVQIISSTPGIAKLIAAAQQPVPAAA